MSDFIKPDGKPEIKYQGKLIQLVHQQMTKGEIVKIYEYAERAPGVRMIIVDEEWKICITKERRAELNNHQGGYDYRLPGGKVIDKLVDYNRFREEWGNIETAAQEAVRIEAREEVGIMPEVMQLLHVSECWATMKRDLYYYVVTKFEHHPDGQKLGGSENIEVQRFTKDEVKAICLDWRMQEDRSVAVLLRYLNS